MGSERTVGVHVFPLDGLAAILVLGAVQDKMAEYWEELIDQTQPPEKVLDAIGLKPGMVVGEVGAGRGHYTVRLAERVGPRGRVCANDIDEDAARTPLLVRWSRNPHASYAREPVRSSPTPTPLGIRRQPSEEMVGTARRASV